jgi:hypothetical protein
MFHTNRYLTHMIRTGKLFVVTVLLLIPLHYSCIKSLNPYTISEAGILISDSSMVHTGDTLQVNATYALELEVELKDFIYSVTVEALGNTLWPTKNVVLGDIGGSKLTFYLKYDSSGDKRIIVKAHYIDARTKETILLVHLVTYTDNTPPLIRIDSLNYELSSNRDTIISDVDSLWLKVRITDANSRLDSNALSIENESFDSLEFLGTNSAIGYKHFDLKGITTNPFQIEISANDIHGNNRIEAYWIRRKQQIP